MMRLYHCVSARSFRALWMLEELGLDYELHMLPFPPRVHQRPYLELNPLGTVPALFDGDVRLTESSAICQYLAQRHSPRALNVEPDEADFGAYLNLLVFGEATLTFPLSLVLRYSRMEPPERRQPQVVDDYSKWFLARLRTLESHLAQHSVLCASRFTAADVAVGYALLVAQQLQLAERFTPSVAAYWQRLQHRDGYQRAMHAQDRAALEQGVSPLPASEVAF